MILLASLLSDLVVPVLASRTTTPTGVMFTRVSRSALARCSSRCLSALAMAIAAWEANISSVSSSSRGERPSILPVRYDHDADVPPPVVYRRPQESPLPVPAED